VLHWITGRSEAHRYDESLRSIDLVTKDAYEPMLPLSVVVHIDYQKAPGVIQRFGDVKKLVEQTLDPMVSAYFKNVGQTRTLIQLLQDRAEIQDISGVQMKEKFAVYNLELQEVLIGTPTSGEGGGQIEQILVQLRSRKIAEEQVETYNRQERAAVKERELRDIRIGQPAAVQADIYGVDVHTVNATEGPAFGVALLAMVGAGVFSSVPEKKGTKKLEVKKKKI